VPIQHIHTYLVHPGKGLEGPSTIGGVAVALNGQVFELMRDIYSRSDQECNIEISFNQSTTGRQQNPCRDLLTDYLQNPTLVRGRHIAERLWSVTDKRSGLGLLFLVAGKEGHDHKIVISRFPADSGILAEEDQRNLTVEFLDRIFMKSTRAYKAAAYQDSSLTAGFWLGRAIDKQINDREVQLSNYWILEFLDSDFRTTAAAGTRRLAVALRGAAKRTTDVAVKSEIGAAVTLAGGLEGRKLSIREFTEQLGLSNAAKQAITNELKIPELAEQRFQFDFDEFLKQVAYRFVELDTGGMLSAEARDFDEIFQREVLDVRERRVRFSTEGKVIREKLGRTR
jgi:hypothetical protein